MVTLPLFWSWFVAFSPFSLRSFMLSGPTVWWGKCGKARLLVNCHSCHIMRFWKTCWIVIGSAKWRVLWKWYKERVRHVTLSPSTEKSWQRWKKLKLRLQPYLFLDDHCFSNPTTSNLSSHLSQPGRIILRRQSTYKAGAAFNLGADVSSQASLPSCRAWSGLIKSWSSLDQSKVQNRNRNLFLVFSTVEESSLREWIDNPIGGQRCHSPPAGLTSLPLR